MSKVQKTRAETADYINSGDHSKAGEYTCHHFGLVELRRIIDFIYGDKPKEDELIYRLGKDQS